jgi:polysaccharide export outer membrane protein
MRQAVSIVLIVASVAVGVSSVVHAQTPPAGGAAAPQAAGTAAIAADKRPPATPPAVPGTNDVKPPTDYEIGIDDVLSIVFWKDKDLTTEVTVRPDGMISLPLLNDVHAAGLTPDRLRDIITETATKYVEDPTVTVIVKTINSRKVFITGQIGKPGAYPLMGGMTISQLIALAGGLGEYADREHITVVRGSQRRPDGSPWSYTVNYTDLLKRVRLTQNNLELKPGDTILVP